MYEGGLHQSADGCCIETIPATETKHAITVLKMSSTLGD